MFVMIWKEVIVACFKILPGIRIQVPRICELVTL